MMLKLGVKVIYGPYHVIATVVDCNATKVPPLYDIRCTNGVYLRGVERRFLEVVSEEP